MSVVWCVCRRNPHTEAAGTPTASCFVVPRHGDASSDVSSDAVKGKIQDKRHYDKVTL